MGDIPAPLNLKKKFDNMPKKEETFWIFFKKMVKIHFLHWSWKENWPTNMKKEAPKQCGEIAKIKKIAFFLVWEKTAKDPFWLQISKSVIMGINLSCYISNSFFFHADWHWNRKNDFRGQMCPPHSPFLAINQKNS